MKYEGKISELNSELSLANHYKESYENLQRDSDNEQRQLNETINAKDREIDELNIKL